MSEALLIVDFQRDFTPPDGALAVPGGGEIAPRLNDLARDDRYDVVIATRDQHPPDHGSFEDQGGPWPPHCVRGTPGAELDLALDGEAIDALIDKGQRHDTEGYSAFEAAELEEVARAAAVTAFTVAGLAAEYCVFSTARDALREGFAVRVDTSATRSVDVTDGDGERALAELRGLGAEVRDLSSGEA